MSKIVAVHQPNYLPWLGYFHKIASADVFIFLDSVQYPRGQSIANRNKIKTAQGWQWLTVPISIPKGQRGKASYLDASAAELRWKKKHLKTLQVNYSRAPYFQPYFEQIAEILLAEQSFAQTNMVLIGYFLGQLEIDTPLYRLSELEKVSGQKSQLIADICIHFEADTYISGQGARVYNDETAFAQQGIQIVYQQFTCPVYPQIHGDFIPNLSALDLLFNCGPESKDILMEA